MNRGTPKVARVTAAKTARLRAAVEALLETAELKQSYFESPLAHETRAALSSALGAARACDVLREQFNKKERS